MRRRRALPMLLGALCVPLAFAAMPGAERVLVDRLIDAVAREREAAFIRNGRRYSAADAAAFMRGKLDAMGTGVKSADEFIAQIASRSSTSGEPYRIRFADGREVTSAEFLRAELQRLGAR